MSVVPILVSHLKPDPTQPRQTVDDGELNRLAESIRTQGLLLPLRVRPADASGTHVLVSGHRRHAALLRLGRTHADCVVVEGQLDALTALAEQLTENIFREDLSPLDEADGYRRYLDLSNITASQLAAELHVPASRISRALPLLNLPENVRDAIRAGTISKEAAYYLTRLPEGEDRDRLTAEALAGRLGRDAAARAAKASGPKSSEAASVGRVTCKLATGRSLTVSGEAITLESLIETLEEVLKEARKARPQGWDVSTLAKVFRARSAKGGSA